MPEKIKTELLIEDESGRTTVAYPFVESEHVVLENGMNIDSMIGKDISTPTTEYEELSFKVDSSAVDSSVSKMTIKGQTYQNILPEPSLRNSMKNGKSMQKFNTGYDSVNVVDGVSKSAILSGQTLVNIAPIKYAVGNISLGSEVTMKASVSDRTEEYRIKGFKPIYNLKANTKYAITVKITEMNNTSYLSSYFKFSDDTYQYGVFNNLRNVGNYIIPFTVGSKEVKEVAIYLQDNADTTISAKIKEVMLFEYQDGMENWDIPYFTGMTSCKMPVLSSIGKNLCPNIFIEPNKGRVHEGNGLIYKDGYLKPSVYVSDYLDIKGISHITYNRQWNLNQDGSNGTQSYAFYDKNKNFISGYYDQTILTVPSNAHYFRITIDSEQNFQLEQGSMATAYEPYKSNILSLSEEVVLRSLPSGVYDTYNIVTKEYVQRIKEVAVTFDATSVSDTLISNAYSYVISPVDKELNMETGFLCDKVPKLIYYGNDGTCGMYENKMNFVIWDKNVTSKQEFANKYSGLKLQYKLATPVIKTVDLSSFGNWQKVVLNGSEEWTVSDKAFTNCIQFVCKTYRENTANDTYGVCDRFNYSSKNVDAEGLDMVTSQFCYITISKSKLSTSDLSGFKQWLSQNPTTIWYPTTISQANSIKEMLSFAKGHIQLSSGAENSLIPSIDYEVPTSNSYHLDLAKTSTKYTMKNMSGTFTVDGTQYNASANGTFTTPSTLTNKLMITSAIQSNAMLLEGDVTIKTIPYFKGIKSAFEDKDKIEVLSCGKNLFDGEVAYGSINGSNGNIVIGTGLRHITLHPIKLNKDTPYIFNVNGDGCSIRELLFYSDKSCTTSSYIGRAGDSFKNLIYTPTKDCYVRFCVKKDVNNVEVAIQSEDYVLQVEQNMTNTIFEPYKSNDVKIPLLSSCLNVEMEYGNFDELGEENYHSDMKRCVDYLEINKYTNHIELLNNNKYQWFHLYLYDKNKKFISMQSSQSMAMSGVSLPINKKAKFFRFSTTASLGDFEVKQIYFNEPYSLPNGVCDEIVLDRENNKAKIIQRVGKVILNNGAMEGNISSTMISGAYSLVYYPNNMQQSWSENRVLLEGLPRGDANTNNGKGYYPNLNNIVFWSKNAKSQQDFKNELLGKSVYYELATPIITEVDIEGYPYIYKDGHIFLNGEIAPKIEIKYSINQSHIIESQNQDVLRHEKEIDYLYKLIGEYVRADYTSTLMTLNLELK